MALLILLVNSLIMPYEYASMGLVAISLYVVIKKGDLLYDDD